MHVFRVSIFGHGNKVKFHIYQLSGVTGERRETITPVSKVLCENAAWA